MKLPINIEKLLGGRAVSVVGTTDISFFYKTGLLCAPTDC
jgi:hypothetical protein